MSQSPRLSSIDLWGDHQRNCLRVLREALASLAGQSADAHENDLNRCLFRAINRVAYYAIQGGEDIPPVVYEGRNPPSPSDRERAEREFKIPDFYWAYYDSLASNPDESYKQFVVECKRLTQPVAHYAREYMQSGIARFINVEHGYGKDVPSGAMVGYLQKVSIDDALAGVNGVVVAKLIPALAFRNRDGERGSVLAHRINRPIPISPFILTHVWSRIGPEPDN